MATQRVGLRTIEQFMTDYVPSYNPFYSLLLGKSKVYQDVVGKLNFRRVEAVGDIRAKQLTPKDTEIRQLSAQDALKTFKSYFLANQFIMSHLQDPEGREQVVAQVLDEHQKQFDELVLTGDGTANNNVVNNGLFYSGDANYITENSTAIASGDTRLSDFHNKVIVSATKADLVAGRKVVVFYGTDILPLYNSLYATSQIAFKSALQNVLGSGYSVAALPAAITPASSGWFVLNLDQVMLHYTKLPGLEDQGSNDEKKYDWFNFVMGSAMVEVLASGGVIRQPATLAG